MTETKPMAPDMQGLDLKALEAAVDALRDLEIKFNPPAGTSIRQATVAEAQRLVRDRLASLPRQTAEPVAWQRRLMNTSVEINGIPAGTWGPWSECTLEQAVYARRWGVVENFPDYLKAEARPLYTHPTSPPVGGALGELLTRVDTQVLTAASEMNAEQRAQPEWLWHVDQEAVTVTYGRWAKLNTQAPYIRADLVLSALASSERSGREAAIYIASKTKHAARWRALRDSGVPINSTWIDEAGEGESQDLQDLWRRCLSEASNASAIIVYREPDDVLKGGWIELGAAASHGVPVFAVGIEQFTIARHKGIQHFDNFDDALAAAIRNLAGTKTNE